MNVHVKVTYNLNFKVKRFATSFQRIFIDILFFPVFFLTVCIQPKIIYILYSTCCQELIITFLCTCNNVLGRHRQRTVKNYCFPWEISQKYLLLVHSTFHICRIAIVQLMKTFNRVQSCWCATNANSAFKNGPALQWLSAKQKCRGVHFK